MRLSIIKMPAEQRFDRTRFNPHEEQVERVIHVGYYTCPHCQTQTAFETTDFESNRNDSHTTFSSEERMVFDQVMLSPTDHERGIAWLDFYCSGCNAPVRILYKQVELIARHQLFELKNVLETKNGG
jgi:hypothetical protein